ncbi:MAG: helicase-related protein [Desulfurivibrionaceae bacterium]
MVELPIDELQSEFTSALARKPVVVEAPPGSGKSTRLPVWCAESGRVLVVEPRRLACRSLARFVARTLEVRPGGEVGYAVRFEGEYTSASRIVFVTPGIALRWYAADRFSGFDTVILDEFHERRWDTDLLAALLRTGNRRLVLTSATVEGRRLADYLGGYRLQAEGKLFEVDLHYSGSPTLPGSRDLDKRVAETVVRALEYSQGGDVLVFLPGKGEIQAARSRLEKKCPRVEVIPLHASVDASSQDRALEISEHSRVILATNVAETSLTLPGVRVVVDSGLERRTHYRGGRTVLALSVISQAAADQRTGRAGRLGPGGCFRLWSKAARLQSYTPPEVVREDPAEFILAAAACGVKIRELEYPDPIPGPALDKALARLQSMGAVDREGVITEHGRRLFPLPLDSQLAHLIAAFKDEKVRADMVDLAAALNAQGSLLARNQSEEGWTDLEEFAPEACDACTLVRLVRGRPPASLRLNQAALSESRRTAEQIRQALGLAPPERSRPPARDRLVGGIIEAVPDLAFVRRLKRSWALGNGSEEVEIGKGTRMPGKAQAAVVLDRHSIPGKGTTRTLTIATCLAPAGLQELARAGLGDVSCREPRLENNRISITAERIYAGRIIDSWTEYPEGDRLRRAVAELISGGRLWPEAGKRLQEEIGAWNLYVKLGYGEGEEVNLQDWLRNRLADIGLETGQDLEALEAGDLEFEGIPEWERPKFDRQYPRNLSLGDMKLKVEYEPGRRRITLVRLSGTRKNTPRRWELPNWESSWELRYRDGNRVVPVT